MGFHTQPAAPAHVQSVVSTATRDAQTSHVAPKAPYPFLASEPTKGTRPLAGVKVGHTQPPRIAVVQGAVWLTEDFIHRLRTAGFALTFTGNSAAILHQLGLSLDPWDMVLYPIGHPSQAAFDFVREVRRLRECQGAAPAPRVLIVSFQGAHLPTTIYRFKQIQGTHYMVFIDEQTLVRQIWSIYEEALERWNERYRLHLRFVHSGGNPNGVGCIPGETLVAAYGSFVPGHERAILASKSVSRFLNVLAANRWRFRNASELMDLIRNSPLYYSAETAPRLPSITSIKTYIRRAEEALQTLMPRPGNREKRSVMIAKEHRGAKEIAYRLLCTAEIEHL
jgi:hypothetical protein